MNAPRRVEIPRFPSNKRIAVTLSFDDGVVSDVRTLDFFNSVGLKATWHQWYAKPDNAGVFFVWAHTFEYPKRNDWAAIERIFGPLAGKSDVWYCTNIELFDYEEARRRMVIAANRATAYNPSGRGVILLADGRVVEVPPSQTISLST